MFQVWICYRRANNIQKDFPVDFSNTSIVLPAPIYEYLLYHKFTIVIIMFSFICQQIKKRSISYRFRYWSKLDIF